MLAHIIPQGEGSIILAGGDLHQDIVQSLQSVDAAFPWMSHMATVCEAPHEKIEEK